MLLVFSLRLLVTLLKLADMNNNVKLEGKIQLTVEPEGLHAP